MKIKNYTPHPVTLRLFDGSDIIISSSGSARVDTAPSVLETIAGIPVPVVAPIRFGAVYGLPEPEEGTIYIVSLLVAQRVQRPDVFSPATGPNDEAIRDENGRIVAVTRLVRSV